jgi:DNA polymerase-3 subunit delta'
MAFSKNTAFDLLQRAHKNKRLAHAYLITGPRGAGKRELAMQLAEMLNPRGAGEGRPDPDIHIAEPESKSRRIVIEQIRNLEKELQMSSSRGQQKVGIIFEADRLQLQASNAFLKTLEEPPAHSVLLLTTSMPESLPDTIVSRCIAVPLEAQAGSEPSPLQQEFLESLVKFFSQKSRGIAPTYQLIREFTRLLATAREKIETEHEAQFESEQAHYKQTTESKWLEDREEYYKALTESRRIEQRGRLVENLLQWWADVARQQSGFGRLDLPGASPVTARLASELSPAQVMRNVTLCEELRANLERSIQEQLAIEVAFLKMFCD